MSGSLLDEQYRVRDRVFADLRADLLGPHSEHEIIVDPPITTYIVGVLFPQSEEAISPEQDHDTNEDGDDGSGADPGVQLAHVRYPSSAGLTFAVDVSTARQLRVQVRSARYEQDADQAGEGRAEATAPSRVRGDISDAPWRRIPIDHTRNVQVDLADPGSPVELEPGLDLFVRVRLDDTVATVTLALINTHVVNAGSLGKDAFSFFQASLRVDAPQSGRSPFIERRAPGAVNDDADLRSYRLLYRHARTYSVGHGCGVDWRIEGEASDYIETAFIPTYELPIAVSNPAIDLPCLSLQFLAEADRATVVSALRELPAAYLEWIDGQVLPAGDDEMEATAREHLAGCADAATRMLTGVSLLERDDSAWDAFRLADKAMLTVRSRTDWLRKGRPSSGPDRSSQKWYPFQLGFILQCLPGVAEGSSPDRALVDLLWFPTGGGKTEAYLGLIAFALFLRRIRRGVNGGGVTALMRYTLRLLTIQQFERAAALICACDLERQSDPEHLGAEVVSLGLWVGGDGTPNYREDALRQLKKLRAGVVVEKGNPVQLRSCPWCGTALDASDYGPRNGGKYIGVNCPDGDCPLSTGIPVFVVDEDVYEAHPTLLIATADKFAGIAWREEPHKLFNLDLPGTPPPELIIQDELHLIAGPLGTLAGMYESAIDLAAGEGGDSPKIVASTATIRRADAQSRALFARNVQQFPPPAVDARDSFFAAEASRDARGTRLYVGLLAPGSSQTTLLVRTYARLLQSALEAEGTEESRDPYWTLLGYFNSLRVLSGARMQVHNDVEDRLKLLQSDEQLRRQVDRVIELTSRESSSDIPRYLQQLGLARPSTDALDVVLATNMISVGVDVDRLGLMVVMGQPQGTAEYIQATSRVGRRHPGLVIDLLNAGRSRDRSHYESFLGYHSALYRQVESTSVTPYSPRARDRALHAALVAAIRLCVPALRANKAAALVADYPAEVKRVRDALVERATQVATAEDAAQVADELDAIIRRWSERAAHAKTLVYWDKENGRSGLLADAADPDADEALPTLWSLRDVDRASNMYLLR